MKLRFKIAAFTGAAVVLLLAGYGVWALLTDDGGSTGATAATQHLGVPSEAAAQPVPGNAAQEARQDEMVRLCAQHMKEMQPVMEQMMRDMMQGMMKGGTMPDGMMDGGMMDGMMP